MTGRIFETADDLAALQDLLDRSMAAAGPHLRTIITPDRRVDAATLSARLDGMRLLALATVTADGRPMVGPVDGIFYRGSFHFGTAPDAVRSRHLRERPQVSATHLPGEEFAVTVHGSAVPVDVSSTDSGFRRCLLDVYVPATAPSGSSSSTRGPCTCASKRPGCSRSGRAIPTPETEYVLLETRPAAMRCGPHPRRGPDVG
ncbi:MAG TPA: pyridoxamine 5'-phosphate oxidase family protein [Acidimicrobiales bacterium]|nr:pyridoxamine 5'-phosphate oxidase family protein [Acidimicrobiales bacterium]